LNDYEQLKSGIDLLDVILQKLKNACPEPVESEPSHNLHTTFTSTDVKVETLV
jgi:hypothetical protein